MSPRARTPEEIRDDFMNTCRSIADYWAGDLRGEYSCRDRILGALHSWLCVIDGVSAGMPAFDLVASPHPDDKQFCIDEGEDWIEPGTVINADDYLHDLLSQKRG
jgi:hypothetical protein